ncbi:MAG: BatA and WFA domain-containing protein [Acidobacteriaceae bacterium]|nr:BatA and WFA domain-containing protein [Acidobacteriaceae bacterium]MBV8573201.1 BatA and WFA domain-containing protein [Acidobacteriaceae bacterium]
MGFLSPWFLLGAFAIALPLWLHLLRQFKRTPQPFSSLMFFERRVQSSVLHRRLRYLALLAARIALLALLALAFANPFVNRTSAVGGRRTLHIVAVDRSFSMRAANRMEQAKNEAKNILNRLPANQLTQVLAVDSRVETLTAADMNRRVAAAAVDALQAGDQASSFGEFARALRVMEQSTSMRLDVHFVSDMQQTSMPPNFRDLQLAPHTSLALYPVGADDAPNWAVQSVVAPARVYDPKRTRVTARVAGWCTSAAAKKVILSLDGHVVASKDVIVPAQSSAEVEFVGFDVPYGTHRGEVSIQPQDDLPEDDAFPFGVVRSDPRKVLFLYADGRPKQAFYYKAALEAGGNTGLTLEAMPVEQALGRDFSKYAFVVLNDVGDPGSALADALCSYVQRGGAVLIALGPNNAQAGRIPLSSDHFSQFRLTQGAGTVDDNSPALASVGHFANVQFFDSGQLTLKAPARVLARLADGSPLLIEQHMGEGRKLIFASRLDASSSDFPLHASFLPFVVQTGQYLAGYEEGSSNLVAGSPVSLRATPQQDTAADVIGPDGKHELSLSEATKALSVNLDRAGFYEVQKANGRRMLAAVHADRRESDLKRVPAETLQLWRNTGYKAMRAEQAAVEKQVKPWSFWRYVMILALLVALVESFIASHYLGGERQAA